MALVGQLKEPGLAGGAVGLRRAGAAFAVRVTQSTSAEEETRFRFRTCR